jgi:UDP-N-acetylmuramyl pentapeptide phosphotransferase/UDP-N-acetylglucosamine-1-phosphate transferase
LVSGFSISIFVAFATSVALISLWDDFRSLSVLIRLGVQLSAAIGVVLVFGSDFFVKMSETPWLAGTWAVFVLIWMVGLTNCFNFMDGIDGIAALQGAVTGGTWAVMGVTMGAPSVSILGTLLGGGSLGFLCYNWTPASIFMGDVGSAFLGFCFGVLPLIAAHETSFATRYFPQLPIFAVLIVWPFVADSLFAFGRRLLKGEKVWTPHRTHFYQRLVQAGCSHIEVTAYYGAWSVACSAVGLFFWRNGLGRPAFISSILFVVVTWALVRNFESRTSRACTDATSPN